jgi:23S rRNA (cytosine1962-C5)-methyltransferase
MATDAFAEEIRHGIAQARRSGRILRAAGAAPDHPIHPFLPESAYLKALVYQLD